MTKTSPTAPTCCKSWPAPMAKTPPAPPNRSPITRSQSRRRQRPAHRRPDQLLLRRHHPGHLSNLPHGVNKLKDLGATIVEVPVPHAELSSSAMWIIAMAEGAAFHDTRLRKTRSSSTHHSRAPRSRQILPRHRIHQSPARPYPVNGEYAPGIRKVRCLSRPRRQSNGPTGFTGNRRHRRKRSTKGHRRIHSNWRPDRQPRNSNPAGFTTSSPTLPVAIQFYGKNFDEASLFRVAHAYESATEWHKRRPSIES